MEFTDNSTPAWHAAARFDSVAPIYPALERFVFGMRLDDARQAFFGEVLEANRILLVGEGNGRFLKSLLARKRVGSVCVVEKSRLMIHLAKRRAGESSDIGLEFIEADFRLYQSGQKYDCVVTHFFLDLFNPPGQLDIINKLAEMTAENGTWINVDFTPPRTLAGRVLMWLQYTFFRMVSGIEARSCFDESAIAAQKGWIAVASLSFLGGLVVAKRYQKGPVPVAGHNTPNTTG